ncbi:hypothetical protein EG835_07970 [bacterium]|nr:hypothetical protein [bacterium]
MNPPPPDSPPQASGDRWPRAARAREGIGLVPRIYVLWAVASIAFSLVLAGPSPESLTRVLVLLFFLLQLVARARIASATSGLGPYVRFLLLGTILAAVVEGFHMISRPVFPSLRVTRATPLAEGLGFYALDLLFTAPAYALIFTVIWRFVSRYDYPTWHYALVMGFGQAIGDGGLFFFAAAPAMLFFLPYPMSNYHAVNVLPYLAVRAQLPPGRPAGRLRYLAIPGLVATYLACGAVIQWTGRLAGLA